ncbi:unnamed protein product [Diabrotica balteata]|uniref:Uncharacterized protein n=1 Tax=Diabrotica balteata TaxID=107213 RepID=A0A9N9TD70_DIABA|nr:unnamed protein product [Diabrotica balteata]
MDRFVIRKRKRSESDQTEVHASTSTSNQAGASTPNQAEASTSSKAEPSTSKSTQNILEDSLTENESPTITHEIKFRDSWLTQFSWLKLESTGQKICKVCNKSIEGSKTHLERHQQNSRHKQLLRQVTSTGNIENLLQNNEQHAFLTSVKKAEYKLVMGLVVEHNSPMLVMDHVPKLLASTVPDSKIIKSLACGRTKTTNMIHMLKREAESVLITKLQGTKFSIIIDETTDISTRKCLAILVRYLDKTSYSVMDSLLTLVEVEECTADGLTSAILNVLHTFNINLENVIGFAADNASVMMGEFGGVQAKLKEKINTNIFVLGCICHSLHLCASEASKKIPSCIEEFIQDVYNYISRSPKRLKVYSQFQEFLEIKPHKILKLSQTRWLSLEAVVTRVLEQWQALKLFFTGEAFEEKDFARPSNILEKLNDPLYELYFTFLAHILPLINKLNIEFQSEKPKLHLLFERITTVYKTILKFYLKSRYVDSNSNVLMINPINVDEYLPNEEIYLGTKVEIIIKNSQLNNTHLLPFYNNCLNFYTQLCLQIRKRFKNLSKFENLRLLNPTELLEKPISLISIIDEFPQLVNGNIEDISIEAREISSLPIYLKNKLRNLEFSEFWFELNNLKNSADEPIFQNICSFVFNILSLPHSSAAAERIFSQLNLIKSKTRNRLTPETCNSLLMAKTLLAKNNCYEWEPTNTLLTKNIQYN